MDLKDGGSMVTMKSPKGDYSIIVQTKGAKAPQTLSFSVGGNLKAGKLCVWKSDENRQFERLADVEPRGGKFTVELEPNAVYSFSTTRGQKKGGYTAPASKAFPMPYQETFEQYKNFEKYGYLPRYTADICGVFELSDGPDGNRKCMRQVVGKPTISWAPDWHHYTIIGDSAWQDYEVSADVYLNQGDAAGIMGRINDVGSGYGIIPKGYYLKVDDQGVCQLVVVRGKIDKKKLVGDAEQQALIKKGLYEGEGGEKVLASVRLPKVKADRWINLKLRFEGDNIYGFVDGEQALSATDGLYRHGMAGMLVAKFEDRVSTPYFDNLSMNPVH